MSDTDSTYYPVSDSVDTICSQTECGAAFKESSLQSSTIPESHSASTLEVSISSLPRNSLMLPQQSPVQMQYGQAPPIYGTLNQAPIYGTVRKLKPPTPTIPPDNYLINTITPGIYQSFFVIISHSN